MNRFQIYLKTNVIKLFYFIIQFTRSTFDYSKFIMFGKPTNQSFNKTLKELHGECYKIISDAIEEDERTKLNG